MAATLITVAVRGDELSRFFPADVWDRLGELGKLRVVDDLAPNDVDHYAAVVSDAEVVVTGWSTPPLTGSVLDAAPGLRLLAHTGASVKRLVTPESWRRGIRVTQAGQAMAPAVAEAALVMTLVLLRGFHRFDHGLHAHRPWAGIRGQRDRQEEIAGARIGVVGASRTGRAYIGLVQALGGIVTVHDPYLRDPAALGVRQADLAEVLRTSQVVALHAPATEETRHLIGAEQLALMPNGAGLVNTARAHLVDMAALRAEVDSGRIDAALDVHDREPLADLSHWRDLDNAFLTPHLAGATASSRRRAGEIVVDEVRRFRSGRPLMHEVTADQLPTMG